MLFSLVSCQKDEEKPKTTAELVKGVWNITFIKTEYYNAANVKVFEESINAAAGVFTISEQDINMAYAGGSTPQRTTYTTSDSNGKKYLNLPIGNGLSQTIELPTLTETNMTWVFEESNVQYEEGGVKKPAAKAIYRIDFQK